MGADVGWIEKLNAFSKLQICSQSCDFNWFDSFSLLYPCDVNIIYILLVVIIIFTFVYIEDMCKDIIYLFAYRKKSLFFNNKWRKNISIPDWCMLRVNKVLLFSLLRKNKETVMNWSSHVCKYWLVFKKRKSVSKIYN